MNHSLQSFSEIFEIHCNLQNGEIPLSEKDFQSLCEQISKVDNKEELKKLYSCLYLFSQNEQITAFILSQFNSMVKENKKMMGLVANKLLLAFKNKPNFLKNLVMNVHHITSLLIRVI